MQLPVYELTGAWSSLIPACGLLEGRALDTLPCWRRRATLLADLNSHPRAMSELGDEDIPWGVAASMLDDHTPLRPSPEALQEMPECLCEVTALEPQRAGRPEPGVLNVELRG